MPGSALRSALARIVTVRRRWSNTTSKSVSISAMSGRQSGSGFGSPSGSTVRTRSYAKKPTAPPANGGGSCIGAWLKRATDAAASA